MNVMTRWVLFLLFPSCYCENKRQRRSAQPLNNPQYQIIPRVNRRNYWEESLEDFDSYEDALEKAWLDGDFGMRSTNYKKNVFLPHKTNRRQRNMKQTINLIPMETTSGNFVVIKGGTFYGTERSYMHKNYGYPKNYGNYYGGKQFQNFRDFADLKKQKSDRRRFF